MNVIDSAKPAFSIHSILSLKVIITILFSLMASLVHVVVAAETSSTKKATTANGALTSTEANVIYLSGEQAEQQLEILRTRIQANPEDTAALIDAGIILHQMNRVTPSQALVKEAEGYLKKAHRANKEDYETLAWLGSTTTMKAQFESDPGRQTFFVKSGSIKMDKSVRARPDNQIIRLTRAYNSLEIPAFLKRTRFAVEDFEVYLELCKTQQCPAHEVEAAKDNLIKAKNIIASNP